MPLDTSLLESSIQIPSLSCQSIYSLPKSPMHVQIPTLCQEDDSEHEEISLELNQDQDPKFFPLHTKFDQDLISFDDPPIPIQEHHTFSSPIGISLLEKYHYIPSILPNNPIESQE